MRWVTMTLVLSCTLTPVTGSAAMPHGGMTSPSRGGRVMLGLEAIQPLTRATSLHGLLTIYAQQLMVRFVAEPYYQVRLSSRFGERWHPILKRHKLHKGIDLAAARGTSIRAAASGTVVRAGRRGAAGKMITLEHEGGFRTHYMHLSRIRRDLEPGARVVRGSYLGAVGTTGRSTGPHLHFGVERDGEPVDPLRIRGEFD